MVFCLVIFPHYLPYNLSYKIRGSSIINALREFSLPLWKCFLPFLPAYPAPIREGITNILSTITSFITVLSNHNHYIQYHLHQYPTQSSSSHNTVLIYYVLPSAKPHYFQPEEPLLITGESLSSISHSLSTSPDTRNVSIRPLTH